MMRSGLPALPERLGRAVVLALLLFAAIPAAQAQPVLDEAVAARLAGLALDCAEREYPNKISHVLNGDDDARPPRQLTPAFYGCFDWHSSVHGHWLLARLSRAFPEAEFSVKARRVLANNLTATNIAAEVAYLEADGRAGFERPYGLAWLLQLGAELRDWDDAEASGWSAVLQPLELAAVERLSSWISKLTHPIRVGEHAQTAFAFGLILDWATSAGDRLTGNLVAERGRQFYGADLNCPLAYEPSGHDFLSPCIAEADFMRRVLAREQFSQWLDGFLPNIPAEADGAWLRPAEASDRSDGKLAHLDGLNLSRAWMLEGIASALADDDARRAALIAAAGAHREAGLAAVTGEHYAGGHWLGSFATYLVTRRGLVAGRGADAN